MNYQNKMNEIAQLIQDTYPAPVGTYTIYLLDKHFEIKPAKLAGNPETIIIQLSAESINHGLTSFLWDRIAKKLIELGRLNLL